MTIDAYEVSHISGEIAEDYFGYTRNEALELFCNQYGYTHNEVQIKTINPDWKQRL